jgi:hypothetical protein
MGEIVSRIGAVAFLLLIVGTLGLLANEFVVSWGRTATLAFAGSNVVGLVMLGYWVLRRGRG